jgi:RNA polymerase sigma factor (sigma-70 family)
MALVAAGLLVMNWSVMAEITPSTNITLLARITSKPDDPEAWAQFVFVYGPQVLRWSRTYGLQEADAQDVAQDVLIEISRQIGKFHYDPTRRFRGWLRVIVHSAWCGWCKRSRGWRNSVEPETWLDRLAEEKAGEELTRLIEQEHERELLDLAMKRVSRRVQTQTWEAFRLIGLEGLSGQAAADRLGMKLGSTFAAKAKVQKLLRQEVEKLDEYR